MMTALALRRLVPALAAALLLVALVSLIFFGRADAQDPDGPPARPAGLRVAFETGTLDVQVHWDDVANADSYLVRWREAGPGNSLNEGVRVETSNADITMADYGDWVVRVEACNAAGCGFGAARRFKVEPAPEPTPTPTPTPTATPTPEPTATPTPEPTATPTPEPTATPTPEPTPEPAQEPPARPGGLIVSTTAGSLDVATDWDDTDGATSYLVRWRQAGAGNDLNDGITVQSSSASITVAQAGDHVVRVEACNAAGCGFGAARRFTVQPAPEPTPTATPQPTATPEPNRAPAVDQSAANHSDFTETDNAPRGTQVYKNFAGIFSDPDGDELTYTATIADDHGGVVEIVAIRQSYLFFKAEDDSDWTAVTPALPDPLVTTVTLTATDPDGLSASVSGNFTTDWDSQPATPETSEPLTITPFVGSDNQVVAGKFTATWQPDPQATSYRLSWRPADGESQATTSSSANRAARGADSTARSTSNQNARPNEPGTRGNPSSTGGNGGNSKIVDGGETSTDFELKNNGEIIVSIEYIGPSGEPYKTLQSNHIWPGACRISLGADPFGAYYQNDWTPPECYLREDLQDEDLQGRADEYRLANYYTFSLTASEATRDGLVPVRITVSATNTTPSLYLRWDFGTTEADWFWDGWAARGRWVGPAQNQRIEGYLPPGQYELEVRPDYDQRSFVGGLHWVRIQRGGTHFPDDPVVTLREGIDPEIDPPDNLKRAIWITAEGGDDAYNSIHHYLARMKESTATVFPRGGAWGRFSRHNTDYVGFRDLTSGTVYDLEFRAARGRWTRVYLYGGVITDVIGAGGINGTLGDDTLTGNAFDNTIVGRAGNDKLIGLGGGDTLHGGTGTDTASYSGSNAAVTVNLFTGAASGGHAGGDTLTSIECIEGSAHDDNLTGDDNDNCLYGRGGEDILSGGDGADKLYGGGDDDTLRGGPGADALDGGAGDEDLATYSSETVAVTVNLATGRGSRGNAEGDTFTRIENVTGSTQSDILTGDGKANRFQGSGGDDRINGGAGNDELYGNAGADVLRGGDGKDLLRGHAGNDELYGDAGADTLRGDAGNDALDGGADNDKLYGEADNDTLRGGDNDDELRGGDGDDELYGDDGNDTLEGGAGGDDLDGGNGTDIASYFNSSAAVTVNLATGDASGGEAEGDTLTGIENVTGSALADVLTGDGAGNVLNGTGGDDTINGGDGTDTLYGGLGNDKLSGEAGDDTLEGGVGPDTLTGGADNDTLTGGLHDDKFRFAAGFGSDTITDYADNEDIILCMGTNATDSGAVSGSDWVITVNQGGAQGGTITLTGRTNGNNVDIVKRATTHADCTS